MSFVRASIVLLSAAFLSGCGYVHFGRLEKTPAGGDAAMAAAYSNLATEHKILKQELVIARKEGDTLRTALELGGAANSTELVARLNESSRELAALRASYAKLQAERAASPTGSVDSRPLLELEDKLATSLRNNIQLQEENGRLRTEVDRTRSENVTLAGQLKTSAAQNEQAQNALAQLNIELFAQKQARSRAEQMAEAVRTQLNLVLAQSNRGATDTLVGAREAAASSTGALQLARAPSADATPTAELRTNAERLRRAGESAAAGAPVGSTPRPRVHFVQAGDTLEKIAARYYGAADRWRTIYDANSSLLGSGQPLRAGMELQLP